jgi:hypothetical protein
MQHVPSNSVDFILTDPPYLVNYRDRSGRTIQNDYRGIIFAPDEKHTVLLVQVENEVGVIPESRDHSDVASSWPGRCKGRTFRHL